MVKRPTRLRDIFTMTETVVVYLIVSNLTIGFWLAIKMLIELAARFSVWLQYGS